MTDPEAQLAEEHDTDKPLLLVTLAVALIGHLAAFVAWFDDVGHLAGSFAFPAGVAATALFGTRGAAAAVLWALLSNGVLGASLLGPDQQRAGLAATLFDAHYVLGHAVMALGLFALGRQADLKRHVEAQMIELALTQERLRELSEEQQQARISQRLSRTDRMASVGTLALGVAHEINNPLTYVIGNLYYALEELSRADDSSTGLRRELDELLRDALDGAERVRRIVHDFEKFSRGDETSEQRADVGTAIETAVSLVRNEIRHRARLELEIADAPVIAGSEARLVQVLVNLLMNASQAIAEGNVTAELIRVSVRTVEDRVHIDISDTGAGMSEQVRARIFDPFFTTKPLGQGTGLGLSVTHGIVTAMGGTISVQSQTGGGTTFTLSLPRETDLEDVREPPPTSLVLARTRRRVLVIDDEPKVGISLKRMLRGDEVVVLDQASEALALLRRDRGFDAVLCDLMMPDVTGMDLYAQVSALDPSFARRFVFITGGAFTPRARAFVADVPNITLEKPFDADRVRRAIDATLREVSARPVAS
jgi:signal transduction histidine kinase